MNMKTIQKVLQHQIYGSTFLGDFQCHRFRHLDLDIFESNRSFPKGKNKKLIGLITLIQVIMKQFVRLRTKIYSFSKGNNDQNKKAKGTKKCIIKRKLKFKTFKNYLESDSLKKN